MSIQNRNQCKRPRRNNSGTTNENDKNEPNSFLCNICLEAANSPVVCRCGHLFCGPCLYRWLSMKPNGQVCPVCNVAIRKEAVVQIYGRDNAKKKSTKRVHPRPSRQRIKRTRTPTENSEYSDSDTDSSTTSFIHNIIMHEPDLEALVDTTYAMARDSLFLGIRPTLLEDIQAVDSISLESTDELESSDDEF